MSQHEFDRSLARWFDTEARPAGTADVLDRALRMTSQRRPRPTLVAALGSRWPGTVVDGTPGASAFRGSGARTSMMLLALLLALALVGGAVFVGSRLIQPEPVDLGIFEPVAGWTVHGDATGVWGDNPDGPDVKLAAGAGIPLGWSRDGTRLLLARQGLVVLDADGTETRVTPAWRTDSQFVRTAAISPDGSRVVFASIDGAGDTGFLFSVDANGGVPMALLERDGLEAVTFSPDGRQIAFLVGRGDSDHGVWLMNADGTNVHEIVANEVTLGPGHDHGLAWSPAGDRIALGLGSRFYTFGPDGSGFTLVSGLAGRVEPFWSPDGSQLETRGPWHPGERR